MVTQSIERITHGKTAQTPSSNHLANTFNGLKK